MIDLLPNAPLSGNEAVEAARSIVDWACANSHGPRTGFDKHAEICARYILAREPGKDVVSGAREVARSFANGPDREYLSIAIARFAAEREAIVREECARIAKEWCDAHGWPENIAAAIRAGSGK